MAALATAIDHYHQAATAEDAALALRDAVRVVNQLGSLAEDVGQIGFCSYCSMLGEQLGLVASQGGSRVSAAMVSVMGAYLGSPSEQTRADLLAVLADPCWSSPLGHDDLLLMAQLLTLDMSLAEDAGAGVSGAVEDAILDTVLLGDVPQTPDDGGEAELLASLAELEAEAATAAHELFDSFGLIDDIAALLRQDWHRQSLAKALQALSLAARHQQQLALDSLCQHLDKLLEVRACRCREQLSEQLPLLLLDAVLGDAGCVAGLWQRADALFAEQSDADCLVDVANCMAPVAPQDTAASMVVATDADDPAVAEDMLAILIAELDDINSQLPALQGGDSGQELLAEMRGLLGRLEEVCRGIGMQPLAELLALIAQSLHSSDVASRDLGESLLLLPFRLGQYCRNLQDEQIVDALLGGLPLTAAPNSAILDALKHRLLAQPLMAAQLADLPLRQKVAQAADVSLAIPEDVNPELMEGLLQELPVQAAAFAQAMQKLAAGQGAAADIELAKRAAHTLKGAANTVGVAGVANLTHHLEDVLIALSEHGRMPGQEMAMLLTEAGDCLENMAEALMGIAPAPADGLAVLQRVLDLANAIDCDGIPAALPLADSRATPESAAVVAAEPPQEQAEAMLRIPAALVDEILGLLGESIVSVAQMRELLTQAREVNRRMRMQNQNVQQLVADFEQRLEVRGQGSALLAANQEFDALEFESYNELHSISRRLTEASTDSRELGLETESLYQRLGEAIEMQHKLQVSNQEVVMRTRMVPVSTIEARLQRAVRQTSRLLDKDVALIVQGEQTLIDSHLLNTIVDPLMHVLRNAVDHGIENPAIRLHAGKDEQGRICLSFAREGNAIVVRCKDDGGGLDLPAIRQKAERLGLVGHDAVLSRTETARLILRHGFSIRDEASQVSGRGIGMDIVLSTVNALKGNLILHSEQEQGLLVEMRFPVSLVASHALLVESQQHRMAISTSGILDLIYYDLADVHSENDGGRAISVGEQRVPLIELEKLFGLPVPAISAQKAGLPAIVLQLDSGALKAVQVQRVIDSRDIVLKDLGQFVPRIPGVLGATVLGDGSVATVVDLRELLDSELIALNALAAAGPDADAPQLPRALVVDDSISARRATTQFMRDSGFEVRSALDGLDAIEQLENWQPDIVLVDMEMPRMNGLELAAYFRTQEHLRQIPIIMITSRSTEKHRRQAELSGVSRYLVKPFQDEVLITQVMDLMQQTGSPARALAV
ncbi:hybrid sensor histidine kinase/response regulator [Chitinilyticum piscinae]|uniref:Chemotaxis protein CheA n=1 Tax=Chitinilyticum piscinae TaxID=2866724 RepID=A0A8J7FLP9_9NEIS|nr:hybrid sensor histidine kinase/response regulator [Chitinilyticum piscinae]MBE9608579.1 response regulator [Chitinilyticum piscinae]